MESQNKYIGDESFKKFLGHYGCPTPLPVVKMKFAGAVCSPNLDLRPADVISSFWPAGQAPRLETKNEADLFFKFFMGLWDEMFVEIKTNTLKLPEFSGNKNDTKELAELCHSRADQIEFGFVEGFWGGCETLSIPNYAAELMASLSDMADVYGVLAKKLTQAENPKDIYPVILNTDQMVEKTFRFLIEHMVLPHIEQLQRSVN